MSASLEITGVVDLENDLNAMAKALEDSGGKGPRAMSYILQTSAQPILTTMLGMVPRGATGKLAGSIMIGRVIKRRKGGYRVTVGVHKIQGVNYANPVEHGHGGPHPAGPHPFVRPAFDASSEAAFTMLRDRLRTALKARNLG